MAGGGEKKEHLYKILVIGELGTGKTSIIKRYVHQFFSQHYRATIGVDFALKVINWDAETIVRLQLWDIAGQERFGNMTRVYYKEAVGAFIVFDLTRASTFDAVTKWKNDLDLKVQLADGRPVPCVLLANKCDQPPEGLMDNTSQIDEFCKERGFIGWFETSAKENINIDEAARFLVTQVHRCTVEDLYAQLYAQRNTKLRALSRIIDILDEEDVMDYITVPDVRPTVYRKVRRTNSAVLQNDKAMKSEDSNDRDRIALDDTAGPDKKEKKTCCS